MFPYKSFPYCLQSLPSFQVFYDICQVRVGCNQPAHDDTLELLLTWNLTLAFYSHSSSNILSLLILQEFIFCFPILKKVGRGENITSFLWLDYFTQLMPSNSTHIAGYILLVLEKCPYYRNISTIHPSMNIIDYLIILQMRFIVYHVHL